MLLDLILVFPIIFFTTVGMRDGIVRKVVAIIALIFSLIIGQIYMREVGQMLIDNAGIDADGAPMKGYLTIVILIMATQSLLYRFVAKGFKLGGIPDRVGGAILGALEGILMMSTLLLIFAMDGFPSRDVSRDSRLYKPIVNIAPQILDFSDTLGPEAMSKLKEITTPDPKKKSAVPPRPAPRPAPPAGQ